MSVSIYRITPESKHLKPYVKASTACNGGILSAVRYDGQADIRVVFCDKYGEVSYPMMNDTNKAQWQSLIAAVSGWEPI